MFYKIIEEFSEIITNVNVSDFREYGGARSLVAQPTFSDSSELHIRDYIFLDGERKYSYHWQDRRCNLIIRWDNSPHHLHIKGFPHHKHLPDQITISEERDLHDIMKLISDKLRQVKADNWAERPAGDGMNIMKTASGKGDSWSEMPGKKWEEEKPEHAT